MMQGGILRREVGVLLETFLQEVVLCLCNCLLMSRRTKRCCSGDTSQALVLTAQGALIRDEEEAL